MLTEDGSLENDRGKWDKARITLDNGELMVELLAGKRRDIAFAIGVSQIKEMRNEGSVFKRLVLRVASPSGGGGTMYKDTSIVVHDREKWMDAIRKEQESSTKSSAAIGRPSVSESPGPSQVRYCPSCGNAYEQASSFCNKCGKPLPAS